MMSTHGRRRSGDFGRPRGPHHRSSNTMQLKLASLFASLFAALTIACLAGNPSVSAGADESLTAAESRNRMVDKEIVPAGVKNPRVIEALRTTLGVACDLSTLWHALQALKISFKKRRSSRPSSSVPTSPRSGTTSGSGRSDSPTRIASSSSTKPGSKRT